MPLPVKVSDRLFTLAKEEAHSTHRSATGQIEHWAALGRAVEAMLTYGDVLALKRLGEALPIPAPVAHEDVRDVLVALTGGSDREKVKARIQAAGTPIYTADPAFPGKLVEVRADGTRTPGHLKGRQFIAESTARRRAKRSKGSPKAI